MGGDYSIGGQDLSVQDSYPNAHRHTLTHVCLPGVAVVCVCLPVCGARLMYSAAVFDVKMF